MREPTPRLLAISVGNTTTRWAMFERDTAPQYPGSGPSNDPAALAEGIMKAARRLGEFDGSLVVLASVNDPAANELASVIEPMLNQELCRVGNEVKIPITVATAPDAKTGQDRLLNALAAWDVYKQACVVVDVGTAITIDFIDGEGVFQGGAIAPGARMWLHALHEHTAALPEVTLARPNAEPFGRNTEQAILNGMFYGIRGMVRSLVEHYAIAYDAYPQVIVTGGDAALLFEDDELIDRIVPDLTLRGIAAACGLSPTPPLPPSADHDDHDHGQGPHSHARGS